MNADLIRLSDLQKFPIRRDHYDRVHGDEKYIFGIEDVIEYAENLPRVDAEPVRHGRWIIVCDTHGVTEDDGWWREWYAKCSKCGRMIPLNDYICETQSPEKALAKYPYCHCGAKMDGDVNATVDAVEVVRCRDCKDYKRGVCTKITYIMDGYYRNTFEVRDPDDFCSKGERKEVKA